jgi:GAF domain-containing protein
MVAGDDAARTPPGASGPSVLGGEQPTGRGRALARKEDVAARLLVPIVVAVLLLTAYNIFTTWRMGTHQLRRLIARDAENSGRFLHQMISNEALRLRSAADTFTFDADFKGLFRARDRQGLLERGLPLFRDLSERYRLTRFYFIEPDGTAFACLHQPTEFGQQVTHATVRRAIETGQPVSGLELGNVALTLRVVEPYSDGDEQLGYIELAERIDHVLGTIASHGSGHIVMVIQKEFLDRARWESVPAEQPLGVGGWDAFDDVVVSSSTLGTLSPQLRSLVAGGPGESGTSTLVRVGSVAYGVGHVPMTDVLGRRVGFALLLHDVTDRIEALSRTVRDQALAGVGIACAVILLSYGVLRGIMHALAASRRALAEHSARLGQVLEREQRVRGMLTSVLREPDLKKVLQLLADAAREMTGAELGAIVLFDRKTGAVGNITPSNYPIEAMPPGTVVTGRGALRALAEADGPVRLDDVMAHPAFTGYPEWHPKVRALLGAPLKDDAGVLGLFALGHTDPARRFGESDETLFATVAGLATVAIRRALTIENIQESAREALEASEEAQAAREAAERQAAETAAAYAQLLVLKQKLAAHNAILEAANRRMDLQKTLEGLLEACLAQFDFDSGGISLVDPASGKLMLRHAKGFAPEASPLATFTERAAHCASRAADTPGASGPEATFLDESDPRFASDAQRIAESIRCLATLPVLVAGTLVGCLVLASHSREAIGAQARQALVEASRLLGPVIANALKAAELERFNQIAAGREDRIIEIKREVNQLLIEAGREPKYTITHYQLSPTPVAAAET